MISDRWRVAPGTKVDLGKYVPASTAGAPGDKSVTRAGFPALQSRLENLQERLWAEKQQSLLVVLQAMDAGGKDGTVKHVFQGVNPAGVQVASFKQPTDVELSHDFLWRTHRRAPATGEIAIFNRSHYEDVLIVRVHRLVPEKVWRPRYGFIRQFEENLTAARTRVIKLFLHISKEEQARRFRARISDPTKHWKFRHADTAERAFWDDYQLAFAEAIQKTTTKDEPWFIVPGDHKWYRNWVVSSIVIEALEQMDPRYPPPEEGLEGVVIE